VVLFRLRKRRQEVAERLLALYVAWETADTHADDAVEAVVRAAAGRLVLLYLLTYTLGSARLRCGGGSSAVR
jgi:hypothetical protein